MKKYEELIKEYVEKNADSLNSPPPSKNRLIKFSEAIGRAILERKKSDTGYGRLAEKLANAGLSGSGYADYLNERSNSLGLKKIKASEGEKNHLEALDLYDERLMQEAEEEKRLREEEKRLEAEKKEKERLEKEKLAAEKKEAERLEKLEKEKLAAEKKEAERLEKLKKEKEKNKNTVLSFAEANKVTDAATLYTYALSLGLEKDDAKEIAEAASTAVREKIRITNVEKVREYIVSQRFTDKQAYEYALYLGLDESDAKELADFAYKLNQDTESIFGKDESSEKDFAPKNQT